MSFAECPCAECVFVDCPYARCCHAECPYTECHYAECYYAERPYKECHFAKCHNPEYQSASFTYTNYVSNKDVKNPEYLSKYDYNFLTSITYCKKLNL